MPTIRPSNTTTTTTTVGQYNDSLAKGYLSIYGGIVGGGGFSGWRREEGGPQLH